MRQGRMYVPGNVGEVVDHLTHMLLGAPKFLDKTGHFPDRDLEYDFQQLTGGLNNIRQMLGEERHRELARMSGRARALFEADPKTRPAKLCKAQNHPGDGGHPATGPTKALIRRPLPFRSLRSHGATGDDQSWALGWDGLSYAARATQDGVLADTNVAKPSRRDAIKMGFAAPVRNSAASQRGGAHERHSRESRRGDA